jgi:NADH:ubiquinone oxidoreductase subunit D
MSIERGRRESTASDADGESIADLIASVGSLDLVLGSVDR